jgi:hypothetical protein
MNIIKNIAIETVSYTSTKYILGLSIPNYFHKLELEDVIVFFINDGFFNIFIGDGLNLSIVDDKLIDTIISESIYMKLSTSIYYSIVGKSNKIVNNIVALGLSSTISGTAEYILDNIEN